MDVLVVLGPRVVSVVVDAHKLGRLLAKTVEVVDNLSGRINRVQIIYSSEKGTLRLEKNSRSPETC